MNTTFLRSCPQCGDKSLKSYTELSVDDKIVLDKLPVAAGLTLTEKQRRLWCARCWYNVEDSAFC